MPATSPPPRNHQPPGGTGSVPSSGGPGYSMVADDTEVIPPKISARGHPPCSGTLKEFRRRWAWPRVLRSKPVPGSATRWRRRLRVRRPARLPRGSGSHSDISTMRGSVSRPMRRRSAKSTMSNCSRKPPAFALGIWTAKPAACDSKPKMSRRAHCSCSGSPSSANKNLTPTQSHPADRVYKRLRPVLWSALFTPSAKTAISSFHYRKPAHLRLENAPRDSAMECLEMRGF